MKKEEELLLNNCFQGDAAAWEELVNNYIAPVAAAIKYTLDKYAPSYSDIELEDLTQGVFISLMEQDYKRLRLFRGERNCSLDTYLRVVAARQAIDYLRKQGREKKLLNRYKHLSAGETEDCSYEFDLELGRAPDIERIKKVIEELSPPERLFLHLHFYRELTLKDTALALNISPETAYTRKSRLLKKFRRLLEEMVL